MMRVAMMLVAGLLVGAAVTPAAAQGVPPRAAQMRDRIEQAFLQRTREELRLTDDQAEKMAKVVGAWGEKRRVLEDEERELRRTIDGQLRPGVAADAAALNRSVEALTANRVAYAQSFQGEMEELGSFLSPVQRAQFLTLRDRLLMRVREMQQGRAAPPAVRRP
jgi:Spy/CpxP family protein refolding chaperone